MSVPILYLWRIQPDVIPHMYLLNRSAKLVHGLTAKSKNPRPKTFRLTAWQPLEERA